MAELAHATFDQTDAIEELLQRDGGVIIDDFATPETVADIHGAFVTALRDEPWCNSGEYQLGNDFFGRTTKRLHGVVQYHPKITECLTDSRMLALARQRLGEHILLSTGELMAIGPGEVPQQLHRDGDSWHRAKIEENILLSINIALTEFRQDNGATVVAPGSHRWASTRAPEPSELAFAEMPAGAALIYIGKTLHGGGANQTAATRMGLYFGYIPAWLRPIENSGITLDRELLDELPLATQRLLGYSASGFDAVL